MTDVIVHDDIHHAYILNGVPHIRAAHMFARKHFGGRTDLICAEIGVQRGDNAFCIHHALQPKTLWLIDPWTPLHYNPSEDYSNGPRDFEHVQSIFADVSGMVLVRASSQETLPTVRDNFFDYIYIDGDHRPEPCIDDIRQGLRTVKVGGILGGHDYLSDAIPEIKHLQGSEDQVALAVHTVFDGQFVYGETSDWWVIVTPELKELGVK